MTIFGTRLKAERLRLGLTQMELAETLGIHVNSQSGYETGANSPTAEYLEHIAARGFNINFLFHGVHDQVGAPEVVTDIMGILITLPPPLQAICFAMVNMFRRSLLEAQTTAEQAEDFFRAAHVFNNFLNLGKQGKAMVEAVTKLEQTPPPVR